MSADGLKATIHNPSVDSLYRITLSDESYQFQRSRSALTLWGARMAARRMLRAERRYREKQNKWVIK